MINAGMVGLMLVILLGMIIVAMIAMVAVGGFRKKWYKVFLANNDVIEVYKTWSDRFWQSDRATMGLFRLASGKQVRISVHWILKIEEQ